MSLSFPESAQFAHFAVSLRLPTIRGADPWSAADALVGSPGLDEAPFVAVERVQGDRADQAVCPTWALSPASSEA